MVERERKRYMTYFRQYDPRLGRWLSLDPVTQPWQSPYNAFDANPVFYADPSGAEGEVSTEGGGGSGLPASQESPGANGEVAGNLNEGYTLREFEVVDELPGNDAPTPEDAPTGKSDPPTTVDGPAPKGGGGGGGPSYDPKMIAFKIVSFLFSFDRAQNHPDDHTDRPPSVTEVHGNEPVGV